MWTDWDRVSRAILETACDPNTSSAATCAEVTRQLDHIEQLEQWVLAFLSVIILVLVWRLWDWASTNLKAPSEADEPSTTEDLFPLLKRRSRHHGQ